MKRTVLAGALAALALAGCPLPQPLPDYPKGTITPPRIVMDAIKVDGEAADAHPMVLVPAGCPAGHTPSYSLSATLVDANTLEQVEARWFVDYVPGYPADTVRPLPRPPSPYLVPPSSTATDLSRTVPSFIFAPYDFQPLGALGGSLSNVSAGVVHVVELVVSNGFDPAGNPPGAAADPPFRGPAPGFETQVYRWTFVNVDPGIAGNPSCPP
jgi:hypothetical protein